jgi:hypothetical protein
MRNNTNAQEALELLYEAREMFFQQLRDPSLRCQEVAEGLDDLFRAIAFAEHPEAGVRLCPCCNSLSLDEMADGSFACLSCDAQWQG